VSGYPQSHRRTTGAPLARGGNHRPFLWGYLPPDSHFGRGDPWDGAHGSESPTRGSDGRGAGSLL